MPQVSYAKHALDCSQSGDMVFLSLWAQVEGGDHGAWPHPSSILRFPLEQGSLTALNHCVALLGAMKSFGSFLWKEPRTACLGFLQ